MTTAETPPAAAPAGTGRSPRWARRWRWLALLAALALLYAAWAPWVAGTAISVFYVYPAALAGAAVAGGAPVAPLAWASLTALGVLIAPWLWSRNFRALAAVAFALWVLLLTLALGAAAAGVLVAYRGALNAAATAEPLGLVVYGPAVAILALVAGWWAALRLLGDALRQRRQQGWLPLGVGKPRMPPPAGTSVALRARAGLITGGAGTLTAGVVLWAIGFRWMPWAVYPCGANTLTGGVCLGFSASQALSAAFVHLPGGAALFDPQLVSEVVPLVLLVGGLLLLYAVWRLPTTAGQCAWVAGWLALATGAVVLASVGVAATIAAAPTSGAGTPSPYPANVVAGVGLALGWLALVPLLVASLSAPRQPA